MKEGQSAIYYTTGSSRRSVENSPHLEAFKEKGYEVLYLVDPVDEVLVQWVPEFDGKKLKSVLKGTADLGDETDLREKVTQFSKLLDLIHAKLQDQVKQVRLSGRLKASPVCLVVAEHEASPQLEKLLQQMNAEKREKQKRIMEVNPDHELLVKMRDRLEASPDDPLLDDFAQVLYGYALLAEGSELENPQAFNQAVIRVMSKVV
jgi:molecular chaperone HtpG